MLYLLLKVASAVGMGLVLKHADTRSLDRIPLIRTNYAVAAVIGFFASVALGQTRISGAAALLAAVTGILFVAGLLIWSRAIQAAGLALSVVAMRSAVVVPLLAAAVIWRERPVPLELVGSTLALLALALVLSEVAGRENAGAAMTTKPQKHEEGTSASSRAPGPSSLAPDAGSTPIPYPQPPAPGASSLLWLLLLFLADGLVMSAALVFRKELPLTETMPFQTIIFVSAFLVTTLLYYLREPRLNRDTLKWGALLGTANFGNYLFLLLALSLLPGLVVYPGIAAGEVGLMALAGVALWKEKVGVRSWLGIALAVAALVLIQLGKSAAA